MNTIHPSIYLLYKTQLTLGSEVMSLKASVTCSAVAPPPTSRKLAGYPPCRRIMSIVDIANPAPFTVGVYEYK